MLPRLLDALDEPLLVGRENELAVIARALETDRLVTLIGLAGIGKTRLAARISADRLRAAGAGEGDPTWFVELSRATSPEELVAAIARALGVPRRAELAVVADAVAAHGSSLLVLDNLEQIAGASAVVDTLLRTAPSLHVLATSRSPLKLSRETLFEVGPLAAAVDLFVARARSVRRDLTFDEGSMRTIAAIVAHLDRIPLAVELAAARARTLPLRDILERLDVLEVFAAPRHDRPPRQTTLRGALDWSWDLLDDRARSALVVSAVFRGPFDVSAYAAVSRCDELEAIDQLEQLVDASLVHVVSGERARFALFGPVRVWADERLSMAPQGEGVRERHARLFSSRAEADDGADLEAALAFAAARRDVREFVDVGLRLAIALARLTPADGLSNPALSALDSLLDASPEDADDQAARRIAEAKLERAYSLVLLGRVTAAEDDARAALIVAERLGDGAMLARACRELGHARFRAGAPMELLELSRRGHAALESMGDRRGAVDHLKGEAVALLYLRRLTEARVLLEDIRMRGAALGDVHIEAFAENGLAMSALELGQFEVSREHYLRCLELARLAASPRVAMIATGFLGLLHLVFGDDDEALGYARVAVESARSLGDPLAEAMFLATSASSLAQRGELAEAAELLRVAARKAEGSEHVSPVIELFGAVLELARARGAATAGELTAWNRARGLARQRLDEAERVREGGGNLLDRSSLARIVHELVTRLLRRCDESPGAKNQPEQPASSERVRGKLILDENGGFTLGGVSVDLSRRVAMRRILVALCEQHESSPGVPLSLRVLVRRGWPEDKLPRDIAQNRVHVALVTLRSLGLRGVLLRRPEGYLFEPSLELERTEPVGDASR